jgi:hypothetical protein
VSWDVAGCDGIGGVYRCAWGSHKVQRQRQSLFVVSDDAGAGRAFIMPRDVAVHDLIDGIP